MKEFKPIFNNSKFVSLWTSQLLSQVTINVMNFLLLLRLFEETGSTIATSLLWVAYALPAILIGPFAAASVDMIDRRKILITTNLLQSLTIFLYALSHQQSLFLLYGIAIVYSFFNQFYVPAEQASLPSLVGKKDLPSANSIFFITQQAAIVLGFGFAGILLQSIGFDLSLYLASILLFVAFLSVSMLPKMKPDDDIPKNFESAVERFFERILQGYNFLKENYSILGPFLLLIVLQVILAVIVVNVPLLAEDILRVRIETSGLFIVAPVALGTLLGGLSVPKLLKRKVRKKKIIEAGLGLLSLSVLSFVFLVTPIDDFLPRIITSMAIILIAGFSFIAILIPSQTFIQEKTPGGLRGRIFGNYWFLVTIATVFPVIFSGAVSELFGIKSLLVLVAAFMLTALFAFRKFGEKILAKSVNYNG